MRILIRATIAGLLLAGTVLAPCAHAEPARAVEPGALPAHVTAPVERLLAGMTDAARQADVGKYMTFVDAGRPLLMAEQRAWATNLRKKPPTAFSFGLADASVVSAVEGGATASVTLAWTPAPDPEKPGDNPEPISVTFPARFEPQFTHAQAGDAGWVFAGVAWEVELKSEDGSGVLCMEADRAKAEGLLEILPGALKSAAECFETETPIATVKLYPTLDLLNASISPGMTSPIAGWNDPGESIKLGAPAVGGDAAAILVHEAAHVVQFTLGPNPYDAPWWVLEGSAERAAALADTAQTWGWAMTDGMVRRWARRGQLANFADLAVYDERMPAGVEKAYIQGHHFVRYLDETYSPEARNVWLRLLLNATPIDVASAEAFGATFTEMDQSWRATLSADAESAPESIEPDDSDP